MLILPFSQSAVPQIILFMANVKVLNWDVVLNIWSVILTAPSLLLSLCVDISVVKVVTQSHLKAK